MVLLGQLRDEKRHFQGAGARQGCVLLEQHERLSAVLDALCGAFLTLRVVRNGPRGLLLLLLEWVHLHRRLCLGPATLLQLAHVPRPALDVLPETHR